MGSSPLYLAIVIVWLIVLVPMLLRRDASEPALETPRRTDRRGGPGPGGGSDISGDEDEDFIDDESVDEDESDISDNSDSGDTRSLRRTPATPQARTAAGPADDADAEPPAPVRPQHGPAPRRVNRARIIARRRRRTTGLLTLLAGTAAAVTAGLGPGWVLIPPTLLLTGHLMLLREAARADTERRAAELRHRRNKRREKARRAAEEAERRQKESRTPANVVELDSRRSDVYDQYADAHIRAAGD